MTLFRTEAARDFPADVGYCDQHDSGGGPRFAAVKRTLELIADWPIAFPILCEPDIRSARLARFSYRVKCVECVVASNIVAVARAKRQPGYWRDRVP